MGSSFVGTWQSPILCSAQAVAGGSWDAFYSRAGYNGQPPLAIKLWCAIAITFLVVVKRVESELEPRLTHQVRLTLASRLGSRGHLDPNLPGASCVIVGW